MRKNKKHTILKMAPTGECYLFIINEFLVKIFFYIRYRHGTGESEQGNTYQQFCREERVWQCRGTRVNHTAVEVKLLQHGNEGMEEE